MSTPFLYALWNASPEIFTIPGIDWPVRWYGFLFAMAFVASQIVMNRIYKTELRPQKHLDILTLYIILGTVLGARLGHMLFYEPQTILENPLEIIMIQKGGLASHGGAIGILLAMWLYCRKTKENWRWIFDRLIIVVALSGIFIRTGNLMNSEIVGKPTDASYGVVFLNPTAHELGISDYRRSAKGELTEIPDENIEDISFSQTGRDTMFDSVTATELLVKVKTKKMMPLDYYAELAARLGSAAQKRADEQHIFVNDRTMIPAYDPKGTSNEFTLKAYGIPRHAAQMYEAIFCVLLFLLFYYLWLKKRDKFPQLFLFGLFCTLLFTERFLDEMLKENQVDFESGMSLNMGQILSIPFVIGGVIIMIWSKRKNIYHELPVPKIEQGKDKHE
jgi:prolipoprotein diacylglyceryl transferase